jgi:hypothetical protein
MSTHISVRYYISSKKSNLPLQMYVVFFYKLLALKNGLGYEAEVQK